MGCFTCLKSIVLLFKKDLPWEYNFNYHFFKKKERKMKIQITFTDEGDGKKKKMLNDMIPLMESATDYLIYYTSDVLYISTQEFSFEE